MHKIKVPEANARLYADKQGLNELDHATCTEDYLAGYLNGASDYKEKFEMVKKHIDALIDVASANEEFYSIHIARYLKELIK